MNWKIMTVLAALAGGVAMIGVGCDKPAAKTDAPADPLPAGLFVSAEPGGVKDVVPAKKEIKDGDEVVIRGKIGGRVDPFTEARAQFVIVDNGQQNCKDLEDGCPTPWDYCCVPGEKLKANMATIQVVDGAGRVLRGSLKDVNGLKPLATVVIKGKAHKPNEETLIVNATEVFVKG